MTVSLPTLHEIDNEIARLSPMAGTFPFAKDALTAWQWLRVAREKIDEVYADYLDAVQAKNEQV